MDFQCGKCRKADNWRIPAIQAAGEEERVERWVCSAEQTAFKTYLHELQFGKDWGRFLPRRRKGIVFVLGEVVTYAKFTNAMKLGVIQFQSPFSTFS